jgi:hypothetical protein
LIKKKMVLWLCAPFASRHGVMSILRGWASAVDTERFYVTFACCGPNRQEVGASWSGYPCVWLVFMRLLSSLKCGYVPTVCVLGRLIREGGFDVLRTVFVEADVLGALVPKSCSVPDVVFSMIGYSSRLVGKSSPRHAVTGFASGSIFSGTGRRGGGRAGLLGTTGKAPVDRNPRGRHVSSCVVT